MNLERSATTHRVTSLLSSKRVIICVIKKKGYLLCFGFWRKWGTNKRQTHKASLAINAYRSLRRNFNYRHLLCDCFIMYRWLTFCMNSWTSTPTCFHVATHHLFFRKLRYDRLFCHFSRTFLNRDSAVWFHSLSNLTCATVYPVVLQAPHTIIIDVINISANLPTWNIFKFFNVVVSSENDFLKGNGVR